MDVRLGPGHAHSFSLVALCCFVVCCWHGVDVFSVRGTSQKKVNPDLQVEVKPSIRARKIQEEKMRKQMQKEEYWRRREEEERWRMEMR